MSLNKHLEHLPSTSEPTQEIKAAFIAGLEKWMQKERKLHYSTADIIHNLFGGSVSHSLDDIIEMQDFFSDLLVFFCLPGNAEQFNNLSHYYKPEDWPVMLKKLVKAMELLENPYVMAEQLHYEATEYRMLTNTALVRAADKYNILLPNVAA